MGSRAAQQRSEASTVEDGNEVYYNFVNQLTRKVEGKSEKK